MVCLIGSCVRLRRNQGQRKGYAPVLGPAGWFMNAWNLDPVADAILSYIFWGSVCRMLRCYC